MARAPPRRCAAPRAVRHAAAACAQWLGARKLPGAHAHGLAAAAPEPEVAELAGPATPAPAPEASPPAPAQPPAPAAAGTAGTLAVAAPTPARGKPRPKAARVSIAPAPGHSQGARQCRAALSVSGLAPSPLQWPSVPQQPSGSPQAFGFASVGFVGGSSQQLPLPQQLLAGCPAAAASPLPFGLAFPAELVDPLAAPATATPAGVEPRLVEVGNGWMDVEAAPRLF